MKPSPIILRYIIFVLLIQNDTYWQLTLVCISMLTIIMIAITVDIT